MNFIILFTQKYQVKENCPDEVQILSNSPFEKLKSYAPNLFGENKKMKDLNLSYSFSDGKFILEETPVKLNNHILSVSGFTFGSRDKI